LKGILWNHFNEHSNKLTNWKMSQLDGLSLVVVGKKSSNKCLVRIGCIMLYSIFLFWVMLVNPGHTSGGFA
jgi:hypothetical protein